MVKILITGYQHSGTTMLMQLLRNHPQVGWIENEENYITYDKPKDWVLMFAKNKVPNLKLQAWGEKIPYGNLPDDRNAERPINFTKKWLKYFGKSSRVINLLRHPIDVASSGIADGKPSLKTLEDIKKSVPLYINFINEVDNGATFIYEDLVLNPHEYLPNIFNFLSLEYNDKIINNILNSNYKFGRINSDRAYPHKKYDCNIEFDYDELKKNIIQYI